MTQPNVHQHHTDGAQYLFSIVLTDPNMTWRQLEIIYKQITCTFDVELEVWYRIHEFAQQIPGNYAGTTLQRLWSNTQRKDSRRHIDQLHDSSSSNHKPSFLHLQNTNH